MTGPKSDLPPVQEVLRRQRDSWAAGRQLAVEDLLRDAPDLGTDADVVLDLVYQERMLREAAGQVTTMEEYVARFPHLAEPLRQQFEVDALLADGEVDRDATLPAAGRPTERVAVEVPGCTVLDELGRGAMGVVYRGWQQAAQRPVAVKVLFADVPASRVRTEGRAAARLHHPHIITVYDVREWQGQAVLVLEYVEGGTLADKLGGRPQPPRDAARLVEQLAWAMAHAHGRGVIHRDLKPSNVLLAGGPHAPLAQCVPKIGDFGLAKLTEGGENLTRTSDILGTPGYMAPEQAGSGEPVGPACDLYALGAILYEALTGRPPFVGATLLQTLERVRTQEPIPPSRLQPTVPHDLEVVCLKCLHKAPGRRYPGARELAEELGRWLAGEPIHARPTGPAERAWKWRRRHPVAAALAVVAAVLALAAGVGGFLLNGLVREERDRARDQAARLDEQLRQTRQLLYTAGLLRVGSIWESDPVQGLRLLEDASVCPPDLRCLGWRMLHTACRRYSHSLPAAAGVAAVVYRPGGQNFAVATDDGQVTLSDAGGQIQQVFPGARQRLTSLAFSRDGGLLAGGGPAGKLYVWETATGRLQAEQTPSAPSTDPIAGIAWHPDGRTLVLSGGKIGKPGTVLFWDVRGARVRRTFREATHPISAVAISPEGDTVAGGGPDNTVRLWDARTGRLRKQLTGHTAPVRRLQFTANGRLLVTGGLDGSVRLWDPVREVAAGVLEPEVGPIVALALHPDGQAVAVSGEGPTGDAGAGESGIIQLGDLVSLSLTDELRGHAGAVTGLAFSPDGRTVLSGSADHTLKTWTYPPRRDQVTLRGHIGSVGSVGLAADGGVLAWVATTAPGTRTGTLIHTVDLVGGGSTQTFRAHGRPVQCLALSPDGRHLAGGFGHPGEPAEVLVWEVAGGRLVQAIGDHRSPLAGIAFGADSRLLTAERAGTIRVHDFGSGKEVARTTSPVAPVEWVAWNRTSGQLGVSIGGVRRPGAVVVWDRVDGPPAYCSTDGPVETLALSNDGQRLACAGPDGTVRLVATHGETAPAHLAVGLKQVKSLAFSPDDRTLAIGGDGAAVKLWDVPTLQERVSLPGHRGGVSFVGFSGDAPLLVTATRTGTARLWRAAP